MEELKLFQSPIFGQVRTVVVNGQVMFAATDVARCLGYTNPQKAIRVHCKSAGVNEMDTPTNGGIQKVKFITKGNLVRLVANSELPQAEEVESWIFDEVIPTVLETGGYISTTPNDTPEEIMARALTIAQVTLAKREERLKQLEAQTEQQQVVIEQKDKAITKLQPKADFADKAFKKIRFSFGSMESLRNFVSFTDDDCIRYVKQAVKLLISYMGFFYALIGYWRLPLRKIIVFALVANAPSVNSVKCNRFLFDKVATYNFL